MDQWTNGAMDQPTNGQTHPFTHLQVGIGRAKKHFVNSRPRSIYGQQYPCPGGLGEAQAWEALAWEALAWRPWPGGPSLVALAWGP